MERLVEVLHPLPDYRRTPLSLLLWWERRRFLYNRVVGAAGLVTMVGLVLLLPGWVNIIRPETLLVIGLYGGAANLCYSLGWAVELLGRWIWGREAPDLGPLLFREGLIFSVGLTLLPLLVMLLLSTFRLGFLLLG
jgi:hypothetical protein